MFPELFTSFRWSWTKLGLSRFETFSNKVFSFLSGLQSCGLPFSMLELRFNVQRYIKIGTCLKSTVSTHTIPNHFLRQFLFFRGLFRFLPLSFLLPNFVFTSILFVLVNFWRTFLEQIVIFI